MRKLFEEHLKHGLSEYDAKYLPTFKYVMLTSRDNHINAEFANGDYVYFVEYPTLEKECDTPLEVLKSEIKLTKSDAGIIYENINGEFKEIAFLDLREKNKKQSKWILKSY